MRREQRIFLAIEHFLGSGGGTILRRITAPVSIVATFFLRSRFDLDTYRKSTIVGIRGTSLADLLMEDRDWYAR